jgi:acyl-CoA synthetase (AMP-forming)/AMP-acid ligase II
VPDERFGELVCALVEPRPGMTIDEAAIIAHVKSGLAGYKAPKHVLVVPTVTRGPNGKLDYRSLKDHAVQLLSA